MVACKGVFDADGHPLKVDIDELLNQSISHGTMLPNNIWEAIKSEGLDSLIPQETAEWMEAALKSEDQEEQDEALGQVFDELNALAPEGFYFGSHPGDGSDYGFWQDPDWDDLEVDKDEE